MQKIRMLKVHLVFAFSSEGVGWVFERTRTQSNVAESMKQLDI